MTQVLFLAIALLLPDPHSDTFDVQAELQGLYDEISQATLQFVTASDVDEFHEVLYTPGWMLVDATGQKRTWSDVRENAVEALAAPRLDSMLQPIKQVSVDADGATVVVNVVTVHSIVDHDGRYGKPEASHTLTDTTAFRDRWVRAGDGWKLKSREQVGGPVESVDAPQ